MTRQEFLKAVEMQVNRAIETGAYTLSTKDIELAVELFVTIENNLGKRHIPTVIQFARSLKNHNLGQRKDNSKTDYRAAVRQVTQQDIVNSDYLIEQIAPSVEQIRKTLFGDCNPPFDSIAAAVSWIRKKAAEPLPPDIKAKEERGFKEYERLCELIISGKAIGLFGVSRNSLDFPGDDGFVTSIPVVEQTDLATLAAAVKRISNATGFREYAVTVHILTGLKPILPRVSTSVRPSWHELPAGNHLWRKQAVIEINVADLTFDELKEIYDNYRKELDVVKKKPLNKQQIKLYNLVASKGGPPRKGVTAFWKAIQEEWNGDASNSPYKTWEGAYQRYKLVEDKFKNLYNETPGQYRLKK